MKIAKPKSPLPVKQILEIAGGVYKRKIEDENRDFDLILYDELISKHKNHKKAMRNLESFLQGLNKHFKMDIRVEIFKRFLSKFE